ncbi:MAG: aminotransferase class III-fold pyridoxal phosphate-dependent enzyme [Beijerinckiaceae bacterium]
MNLTNLMERDARIFFHQHGSTPALGVLRGAQGIWLEDERGRRIIDLHGNTTHHIGHAHPRLIAAIKDQLDRLAFSPRRYSNEAAIALGEKLTARFRNGQSRLLLATGGSDAIEISLRLARAATGKSGIIALEGSYHGHGFGSLALSSRVLDPRLGSQMPDIHHVTPYWNGAAGGADRMIDDVRALLHIRSDIACLIAEPMRSNCIVPSSGMWRDVGTLCERHGVKLIFDEIPSGLGKTGRFFAHQHFNVTPDLVVLGKALGGGILPIAAVLADRSLDVAPDLALGHYTHEKNPVTARAALTTIDIIDDEDLTNHAERRGRDLDILIQQHLANRHPVLSGARGLGLLRAVTFAADEPQPTEADLVRAGLVHGVSFTMKGRDAVGFSPPLTITETELGLALGGIVSAIHAVHPERALSRR